MWQWLQHMRPVLQHALQTTPPGTSFPFYISFFAAHFICNASRNLNNFTKMWLQGKILPSFSGASSALLLSRNPSARDIHFRICQSTWASHASRGAYRQWKHGDNRWHQCYKRNQACKPKDKCRDWNLLQVYHRFLQHLHPWAACSWFFCRSFALQHSNFAFSIPIASSLPSLPESTHKILWHSFTVASIFYLELGKTARASSKR